MISWWIEATIVDKGGNVYYETYRSPYAPLWYWLLYIILKVANNNFYDFRLLVSFFLTCVDTGIFIILWIKFNRIAAFLFFLNPISIIITGYHSQFDNLAILIGLLAVIIYGNDFSKNFTKKKLLGIVLLGISITFKHVFFAFPLWMAAKQKGLKQKLLIIILPVLLFFLSFAPYYDNNYPASYEFNEFRNTEAMKKHNISEDKIALLYKYTKNKKFTEEKLVKLLNELNFSKQEIETVKVYTKNSIIQNVFLYRSSKNYPFYGFLLPHFLFQIVNPLIIANISFIIIIILGAFIFRKRNSLESLFIYTFLLVIFSPSIANQYLAIVVPGISVFPNIFFFLYSLLGTYYLFIIPTGLKFKDYFHVGTYIFLKCPVNRCFDVIIFVFFLGFMFMCFNYNLRKGFNIGLLSKRQNNLPPDGQSGPSPEFNIASLPAKCYKGIKNFVIEEFLFQRGKKID